MRSTLILLLSFAYLGSGEAAQAPSEQGASPEMLAAYRELAKQHEDSIAALLKGIAETRRRHHATAAKTTAAAAIRAFQVPAFQVPLPKNARQWQGIGNAYSCVDDFENAAEAYKNAIRLDPQLKGLHSSLGASYARLGRWHNARDSLLEAVRLNPDDVGAHLNLARCYVKLDMLAKARDECAILRELKSEVWCFLLERELGVSLHVEPRP